ncbi:MAG TPA: S9 family peptidase [Actinomycetota bacterium]|nr:S9 family peptidase [Actinomycetota bacterium]
MARTPFVPKAALKQVLIAGATVSPDGASIVYAKRTIEKGKERSRLWRVPVDGGRPERLTTAAASDAEPRFSPDGRSILFTSDRRHDDEPSGPKGAEPKTQLWVLPVAGGEPRRLAPLPEGASGGMWSPDGARIVCLGPSGEQRFLVGKPDDQVARRITSFTWRLDGEWIRDQFTSAWVVPASGDGKPMRVTAPDVEVSRAFWSPDGSRVGFLADRSDGAWSYEAPTPWSVPASGAGTPRSLADFDGFAIAATWTGPREVVFTGTTERAVPWRNVDLFIAEGTTVRRLAHDDVVSFQGLTWSELAPLIDEPGPIAWGDGRYIVLGHALGSTGAYVVDREGRATALTEPRLEVAGVAAGGARLIAIACDHGDAAEVYELDPDEPGRARRITRDGARWFAPFHHATTDEVSVPRGRGRDVQAWFTRASGRRGTTRRPLVLHVHGGPYSAQGPTPLFGDLVLADAGFHVLSPNPAGSTGFGEDHARSLHGRWGVPDGADLMASIDWAVSEGLADPDRIGVLGLSYGGFMVHRLLGEHPGRFRAAVSENPFTMALADLGAGDSGHMMEEETGVGAWPTDLEGWLAISPAMRIHRNTAPLLLLQADHDVRCPPVHSEIAFAILRKRGMTVEMIRYPEESHIMLAIGRPDRRVDRLERILGWFSAHL